MDLQRANETLHGLSRAYQEGRLQQGEYRQRRRQLLDGLADSAAITHRNGVSPRRAEPSSNQALQTGAGRWRLGLLVIGVVLVLTLVGLLLGGVFDV
ncbi:hypothetical protein [Pseudoxanthomonas sp.]|uniref:hypothetical protein n=1 Tax=Pseudoxanthomonas sp. TaxID=1871049 RepID=UPI002637A767|nr:hypothetical protein [Pseudoxanthomonas sp.]WDS37799.1 MAG: hypothetical protein O8I58_08005 [Pseudoxanthomonas sp.]